MIAGRQAALVDAVDHLLNRGAVVLGEVKLSLADVDLIGLKLNLLLSSVESLDGASSRQGFRRSADRGRPAPALDARSSLSRREAEQESERPVVPLEPPATPPRLSSRPAGALRSEPPDKETADRGLAQLVLTLVDLIRQLMERQALRRVEKGHLSDEQVERMGLALMELEAKVGELCDLFDFNREDLNLDLGPLGRLL